MRVAAVLSSAAAVPLMILSGTAVHAAGSGIGSTLTAGHCLVADPLGQGPSAERISPSGVFALQVTGELMQLNENETFADGFSAGTTDWWQFLYPNSGHLNNRDKSRLCMKTDGNLVFRTSTGRLIWSSHTAGTGSDNTLTVRDDGSLTISTAAGKRVWSSGTTRTILIAGRSLGSGQHLVYRYRQQFGIAPTWLIMRRGGDLVLERDSRVLWGTGTHVAGSHASLLTSGNLVVYGPGGRVLWQSHTSAHDAFIELNCGYVSMSARSGNPAWHEPAGPQPAC